MIKEIIGGIKYRIPPCCVIAYCLGKTKGVFLRSLSDVYRPCFFHRKNSISDKQYLELLNEGVCPLPNSNFDEEGNYWRSYKCR